MASFPCWIRLFYRATSTGRVRLTPDIATSCDIVESSGRLSLSIAFEDFGGTNNSIPSDVSKIDLESVWIQIQAGAWKWERSGTIEITRARLMQSSTSGSNMSYQEAFANMSSPATATPALTTHNGVRCYLFSKLDIPAVSSFNTSAGHRYVSVEANTAGILLPKFEPGRACFVNGECVVSYKEFGVWKYQLMKRAGALWFPVRNGTSTDSTIKKMVIKGLWAFVYVQGRKYRLKLANYEMGVY